MSHPFWLYRWMDEFDVTSERRLEKLLKRRRRPLARLQEIAADEVWGPLKPHSGSSAAILAGRGADLSGDMDCCHSVCQRKQVDALFSRVLHYFDEIVVAGPPAHRYSNSLDPSNDAVVSSICEHVKALLYLREAGIEPMLTFVQKPPACEEHYLQHAEEVGVLEVIEQGHAWISHLAQTANLRQLYNCGDHWHYALDDTTFEHTQYGVIGQGTSGSRPTISDIASAVYTRYAAHLVSDVSAARQLGLPLGPFMRIHAERLKTRTSTLSANEVAFELRLPVLSQLPIREIVSIRNHEWESFEAFQRSLRTAIQERIEAQRDGDLDSIVSSIYEEVLLPSLGDISRRLEVARSVLARKTGLSIAAGVAFTAVGLLSGAPLITGFGVAALGTAIPAAQRYLDDRGNVELRDMYFLWRLASVFHECDDHELGGAIVR